MIQRIQSVYLLLVIILSAIFMTGPVLTTNNSQGQTLQVTFMKVTPQSGTDATDGGNKILAVTVLSVLIPSVALIAIFLYRNRRIQLKAVIITLCSEIILIGYTAYYIIQLKTITTEIVPGFRVILPLVYVILTLLAIRGIRKDENLVKSYDRLR